jgi:hypothetical protein
MHPSRLSPDPTIKATRLASFLRHCEPKAKRSIGGAGVDCFVAALLATTAMADARSLSE